jgi:hypothetical protein
MLTLRIQLAMDALLPSIDMNESVRRIGHNPSGASILYLVRILNKIAKGMRIPRSVRRNGTPGNE